MDKQKYISLVSRLRQVAAAKASSIVREESEVEDIVQEVLLKMWERLDELQDDEAKAFGYASTIAKNIALNKQRSKRRHPILRILHWGNSDDDDTDDDPISRIGTEVTPLHLVQDKEVNELFLKSLKTLPYTWQRVLIMRNSEDRSFEEIAQILDTTESSVRGILSKARKRMVEQIKYT